MKWIEGSKVKQTNRTDSEKYGCEEGKSMVY